MTESNRSTSQDDPYPDEYLLEGLQRLVPQTYLHGEVARGGETDGSMLLDSINEYLHNTQTVIETIQENVQDEQEPFPLLEIPPLIINQEIPLPAIGEADGKNSHHSPVFSLMDSPKPVQQVSNTEEPKLQSQERNQAGFLLSFSHYNSRHQQSRAKTDLNSSLFVEVSGQKSMEFNFKDPYNCPNIPEEHQFLLNNEGSSIANQHTVLPNNQNNEQKDSQVSLKQKSPIKEHATEEDKHGELSSNYSIDSSKITGLIPSEYLAEARWTNNQRIEQTDNQYHISPDYQQNQNEKKTIEHIQTYPINTIFESLNIPMEIQSTYTKPQDIPMEIQVPSSITLNIPMDVEENFSKTLNIPMEIESVVFACQPHNNNQELIAITLDPIKQDTIQQLEEQQRQEQQEMLDSISGQRAIANHQVDHYKEFTFGKEHIDNLGMEFPREDREDIYKDIEQNMVSFQTENMNNTNCNQVANSYEIQPAQNESFWNSLREDRIQNLSMNVEHDNNFTTALFEVEEMIGNASKNEPSEVTVNNKEPILTNVLDEMEIIEIDPQQVHPANSSEERPVCKQADTITEKGPNNVIETIAVTQQNELMEQKDKQIQILENYQLQQDSCANKPIFEQKQPFEQNNLPSLHHQPDYSKFTIQNQVCNLNFGSQHGHHNLSHNPPLYRCQQYEHPCHHQCYDPRYQPIFNNSFLAPHQNQAAFSNQAIPQQPLQQVISMQPWLTINYKMNETSVSLFGPAFSPSSNKEELIGNVKKISKEKKVEQPSKREEAIMPMPECFIEQVTIQAVEQFVTDNTTQICQQPEAKNKQNSIERIQVPKPPQKQFVTTSIQATEVDLMSKQYPEQQVEHVIEDPYEKYELLIKQSENYLISFDYKAESAHKQFQKIISPYVLLKFTPEPKNQIGSQIFKNGLFLIALVKLTTRSSPNPFIFYYMYEYLESAFGHCLERNSYFFKNECQKAKNNYEMVLEKKYGEMLLSHVQQKQQAKKNEAIKRNCITSNPFFSVQSTKQDEGFQVGSQKLTTPKKVETTVVKQDTKQDKSSIKDKNQQKEKNYQQKKTHQQEKTNQYEKNVSPMVIETSQPSKKQNRIEEPQIRVPIVPIVPIIPITQPPSAKYSKTAVTQTPVTKQASPAVNSQKEQKLIQKSNPTGKSYKDLITGQKIKKNIEEIKSSFPSSNKNEKTPDSNVNSRINDLYDKYRRIRQDKQNKSDIPIEDVSIKRNLISQMLKADQEAEKNILKKQVVFVDDVIKKDVINTNKEDVEKLKKDKKKKVKSKRENSSERSDQEDVGVQVKTRRTLSKKEK